MFNQLKSFLKLVITVPSYLQLFKANKKLIADKHYLITINKNLVKNSYHLISINTELVELNIKLLDRISEVIDNSLKIIQLNEQLLLESQASKQNYNDSFTEIDKIFNFSDLIYIKQLVREIPDIKHDFVNLSRAIQNGNIERINESLCTINEKQNLKHN
ncbi:hypothetical protein [Myxosarcina sp. GI1]|uniref:hypothetical protein n=1 Tax=Myxosarcina sp. GI1 TaxID=1541065 RepID=UPI00055D367B|nr:hypothetical protein [Myxosarcina sp. GI1]